VTAPLAGRRAVITGGGSGIGRGIAEVLVAQGAEVALIGRRPEPLQAAAQALRQQGGRAHAFAGDVRDRDAIGRAVQEAQPLSVEGDVVTFGVSPRLIEAARPRFRREADAIRKALSRHVGASLRFNLVEHEGFSGEPSASAPSGPPPPDEDHDDVVIEPDEAAPPPGVESSSPTSMLAESLGATVVEERHHE